MINRERVSARRGKGVLLATAVVLFGLTKVGSAQESIKPKVISEVHVIGSQQEKILMESPTEEPLSLKLTTSTINLDDIEKQGATTIVDAMQYVPGAVIETRGRKVKQFFSIRGQKYPYPSYSYNGIIQKQFEETTYFINASSIGSIEIIRSSSALLKSLTPLTGVINIESREYLNSETSISAKYGTLNSYNATVAHGNSCKSVNYSVVGNIFGTDGPADRNGAESVGNITGELNWAVTDKLDASFNLLYVMGKRELVQPTYPADEKFLDRVESYDPLSTLMASTKITYRPTEKFTTELQVNVADRKPIYKKYTVSKDATTESEEFDNELTINLLNSLLLGERNVLRFGALYNHWKAPNGKRYYTGSPADSETWSVVATDQHRFGAITVDGGLRISQDYYSEWGAFSIEGSAGKFKSVAAITDEWQSPVWQASAGATYSISNSSTSNLNIAGGIVTPRKGALTDSGEAPLNEKRRNIDLGTSKSFDSGAELGVALFSVKRDDAIEYSGTTVELDNGDIMELYMNVDKRNYGVEITGRSGRVANLFSAFANVTLMQYEIDNSGSWESDDESPNVVANLGINGDYKSFDLNIYANYVSSYKNDRFVASDYLAESGKAPLGDFCTLNSTLGYTISGKLATRIYLDGKNLFDTEYQTVAGYPDNGRIVSLGFKTTI